MKLCPNCSEAIPILRIARCQNTLVCPRCGLKLWPDRRSQILMFGALVAFFPIALFLARRLTGHSFVFGLLFGLGFGLCAGGVGCLIYAWTVRLHTHQANAHRSGSRSWGGLV
jgi:hypothetical protein